MKLSKFDGDIRNYPRFKFDFKKYTEPRVAGDCCYDLKILSNTKAITGFN